VDLFTHVLVAYLLTYGLVGFQPSYLIAGALAGGLPDADILLYPLSRRWPIFRHHGITHSIFGVTVVALVGGIGFAPYLAPGDPLVYFAVMEAAGLTHVFLDGLTHFSVPPLLPFSERKLELDADRAINFVTLVVSVFSLYLLLGVERNHVAFPVYVATLWVLSAFFLAYFGLRLVARLWVGQLLKRQPQFAVPIPTGNPLVWLLLKEEKTDGRVRTTFARYRFGRGIVQGPFRLDVPVDAPADPGPPRSETEALARTYGAARKASPVLDDTYHFGEAHADGAGVWEVVWYSLEFSMFGRAAGVRVRVMPDGSMRASRSWFTPLWQKELA
jgi:membrane-bound metal-dependent hydrolase YbcI (DUF457 family)